MRFFENTRKPQGFGGKLMTKMMNSGHAKLSQWGFSNISTKSDAEVLDVGCGGGANIAVMEQGVRLAEQLIDNGAARLKLEEFARESRV